MTTSKKIASYLALTVTGITQTTSAAVTWYDGRTNTGTGSSGSGNAGFSFSLGGFGMQIDPFGGSGFVYEGGSYLTFTDGASDIASAGALPYAAYGSSVTDYGAQGVTTGSFSTGYSQISFAGVSTDGDNAAELIVAFDLDGTGSGSVIATADLSGSDITITQGFAQMVAASGGNSDFTQAPEPSGLALLGLGASGLLLRRQRKVA